MRPVVAVWTFRGLKDDILSRVHNDATSIPQCSTTQLKNVD